MTLSRSVPAEFELTSGQNAEESRVEAINILTATRLGLRARAQDFGFWLARRPRWQAENLAGTRTQALQLKRLNFIHTARWVDVGRFPRFPASSKLHHYREPFAPYRWTLFLSNLNQGWEPYLQSFLDSFGSGINTLWGDSLDYPGYPRPATRTALNQWVQHRLPISQVFYGAYPHLSTNDVRCVLRASRELRSAKIEVDALRVADPRHQANETDARRLAERLQHCLIDIGEPPIGWWNAALGPASATGLTGFVSLMPIRPGAEPEVARALAPLAAPCNRSVFTQVPGTHFARFAILDHDRAAAYPERKVRLKHSWLLFSADYDAKIDEQEIRARRRPRRYSARYDELRRYMTSIINTSQLRDVFALCYPDDVAPDPSEMISDLTDSICKRLIYFRDYPDTTLGEIVAADRFYRSTLHANHDLTESILNYLQS